MSEENAPQKERFLREVEQQLLRKDLDARLLEDGLIHVRWNEKPLCSVDRDGIVRFRPADITGPEVDKQLRTVIQTAGHVKEYMRIFERAPALKAVGLDDTYKVLADFGDAVLAGQLGKKGARFVTWEWDFDRQGVHAGHYFMENYDAAKAGLCCPVPVGKRTTPFFRRAACRDPERLRVCTGGQRDALVCRRKAAPQRTGADRAASAAAGTGAAPHNGTDNVIFRRAGISFQKSRLFAFREEFHETQSRRILEAAFIAPPLRSHPDPPPTIQCSWYPHEGQCPYMRLALGLLAQ